MAKLKLVASPTFKARVGIPIHGEDDGKESVAFVVMTFKHRTKDQLSEFIEKRVGKTDAELFMEMVTGWDLEDEFNFDNVSLLMSNYMGAGLATFHVYLEQHSRHKVGN